MQVQKQITAAKVDTKDNKIKQKKKKMNDKTQKRMVKES
jgi:hypothetical protein